MLIDSHCHLNYDNFKNVEDLLKLSTENNVDAFIAIGASDKLESCKQTIEISKKSKKIFPTIGLHPHDAKFYDKVFEKELEKMLELEKNIVAIGEIGLDYYYNHSSRDEQISAFKKQMNLAKKYNLPIIIHTRDAEGDTFDIINDFKKNNKEIKILLHCFSGTMELAKKMLKIENVFFSFSGIITFKNANEVREVAEIIPLEKIMVETDSPYLAPVPFRGKSNHPAYVRYVAEKLAEIKNKPYSYIEEITRKNTIEFFNLPID